MTLPDTTEWTWDDDYRRAYAPTDDPRVLAVIERDDDYQAPDGDCYAPAFQLDSHYGDFTAHPYTSVYMDDASERIARSILDARDRFQHARLPFETVERYARIFHGTTFETMHRDYTVLILNTPSYREHVGLSDEPQDDHLKGDVTTWQAYLDGDVFGVGYAVNASRTFPGEDDTIDLSDWDVSIECWGYYGDDEYVRDEAMYQATEAITGLPLFLF